MFEDIAIIIPKAPNEDAINNLLDDLSPISDKVEIIISSEGNRAKSLNKGVEKTDRKFLWFLHADSRISGVALSALLESIKQHPEALHYFNLSFYDGTSLTKLNSFGAKLRSDILGIPFGDQGFCVSKNSFHKIGGFPEDVPYGEDHLFIWQAKQAGIKLACTGETIGTSARKYKEKGWLYITLLYQYLWIKQALPELIKRKRQ